MSDSTDISIAALNPRSRAGRLLSIVVPMHNEAEVLGVFFERIEAATKDLGVTVEIICADDGESAMRP